MRAGREFQEGRGIVYLRLIHVVLWQQPAQHRKAIILELKIKRKKKSSSFGQIGARGGLGVSSADKYQSCEHPCAQGFRF